RPVVRGHLRRAGRRGPRNFRRGTGIRRRVTAGRRTAGDGTAERRTAGRGTAERRSVGRGPELGAAVGAGGPPRARRPAGAGPAAGLTPVMAAPLPGLLAAVRHISR